MADLTRASSQEFQDGIACQNELLESLSESTKSYSRETQAAIRSNSEVMVSLAKSSSSNHQEIHGRIGFQTELIEDLSSRVDILVRHPIPPYRCHVLNSPEVFSSPESSKRLGKRAYDSSRAVQ